MVAYSMTVRVITPPDGINDARQWKRAGATQQEVLDIIDAANVRRLSIRTNRKAWKHKHGQR